MANTAAKYEALRGVEVGSAFIEPRYMGPLFDELTELAPVVLDNRPKLGSDAFINDTTTSILLADLIPVALLNNDPDNAYRQLITQLILEQKRIIPFVYDKFDKEDTIKLIESYGIGRHKFTELGLSVVIIGGSPRKDAPQVADALLKLRTAK